MKNYILLDHNCGRMCACGTCHVYREPGKDHLEVRSEQEEDFIDRTRNPRLHLRLSCQCVLREGKGKPVVTIPDQLLIHGE